MDHCRDAVRAGVDLIEIREPDLEWAEFLSLATRVVDMARDTPTRVIVTTGWTSHWRRERTASTCAAIRSRPIARDRWRPPGF